MKKKLQSISDSVIQLEISKIRKKYEDEGFKVSQDIRRGGVKFDLFAEKKETSEKIVFEVKSKDSTQIDISLIVSRRDHIKKLIPGVKFYIVLAKEEEIPKIEMSFLNKLLLEYILENNSIIRKIEKIIPNHLNFGMNQITDIEFSAISLNEFNSLLVSGFGNYKFWAKVNSENFRGSLLSDGLPFKFSVNLSINPLLPQKYDLTTGQLEFDFSEFKSAMK